MKLHIFNPEHDMALAANLSNFTAPHAGRLLRSDLGFLPALWAKDGEAVLVDCVEVAQRRYNRLRNRIHGQRPTFVDKYQLARVDITEVEPWGWDLALRTQLLRYGVRCVPAKEFIAETRRLSHRRTAARLLPLLQMEGTVGEALECQTLEEVCECLKRWQQVVLKAPWSSSGRGVRFVDHAQNDQKKMLNDMHWVKNVITGQGSVMVEPYYKKVRDFGMEFLSHGDGRISYEGLSLFHTANGAYTGNILATEADKIAMISRYVSVETLQCIKEKICDNLNLGTYAGPFGVDMMATVQGLHPCVEINLRRTMGHVALALTPMDGSHKVMRIQLEDNYKLKIRKL
ncbi:MAG: hypothetical protein IJ155_03340 [Prevotella sp.]|nr:hypothetical protein [Prevotella sp.]MBQ9203258.1 hypothetical protein [Prevotella sp.]